MACHPVPWSPPVSLPISKLRKWRLLGLLATADIFTDRRPKFAIIGSGRTKGGYGTLLVTVVRSGWVLKPSRVGVFAVVMGVSLAPDLLS